MGACNGMYDMQQVRFTRGSCAEFKLADNFDQVLLD